LTRRALVERGVFFSRIREAPLDSVNALAQIFCDARFGIPPTRDRDFATGKYDT
jgi:hypothetical protein